MSVFNVRGLPCPEPMSRWCGACLDHDGLPELKRTGTTVRALHIVARPQVAGKAARL